MNAKEICVMRKKNKECKGGGDFKPLKLQPLNFNNFKYYLDVYPERNNVLKMMIIVRDYYNLKVYNDRTMLKNYEIIKWLAYNIDELTRDELDIIIHCVPGIRNEITTLFPNISLDEEVINNVIKSYPHNFKIPNSGQENGQGSSSSVMNGIADVAMHGERSGVSIPGAIASATSEALCPIQ